MDKDNIKVKDFDKDGTFSGTMDIKVNPEVFKNLMLKATCDPYACGGAKCCTNILMISEKEILRIKNYIGRNLIKPINYSNILTGEYVDKCPFLNKNMRCNIYEVRPEVCKCFDCNLYKKEKQTMPNYRDKKIVNMLLTFNPNAIIPNAPDVEKMNKEFSQKKRQAYGILGQGAKKRG